MRRRRAARPGRSQHKLRRAANLNLVPDLNDGVVLNIAPLRGPHARGERPGSYWDDLMGRQSTSGRPSASRYLKGGIVTG